MGISPSRYTEISLLVYIKALCGGDGSALEAVPGSVRAAAGQGAGARAGAGACRRGRHGCVSKLVQSTRIDNHCFFQVSKSINDSHLGIKNQSIGAVSASKSNNSQK
jgi:hypothetical protein